MQKLMLLLPLIFSFSLWAEDNLELIKVTHGKDSSSLVKFVPATSVLKEKELIKRREVSLGETLRHEAGVQSTGFGPNASRPIIRGLEGDRIRILQNGLGTLDASNQSVDHALPIDTLTIDQIEVLRGPMSLLYGPSPVGGVVNIVNNRIHGDYSEGVVNQLDLRGESVNNGISGSGRADYGAKQWMMHFDGSYQNLAEQKIPRYARSKKLRAIAPVDNEQKHRLKNSENNQSSLGVGISRIFERGHLGISYYRFDNEYGSVAEEEVDIKMAQNRIELSTELRPEEGAIKKLALRSAQSFYKHEEIEGETIGTVFHNTGNESRLEVTSGNAKWNGVSGLQTQLSTFKANGDEAFLPTSKNNIASLFTLQQYQWSDRNRFDVAARLENTSIKKEASDDFGAADEKGFTGLNGSLGHHFQLSKSWSTSASLSYNERAPNFQEQFANGEHVATHTFEEGSSTLKKEKGEAFEFSLKKVEPDSTFSLSGFVQRFQNYIFLAPLGTFNAGPDIPDFQYQQDRAVLYGGEIDSSEELAQNLSGGSLWLNSRADLVIGKNLSTGHYLPRMPAPRVTIGLNYKKDRFDSDVELEHWFEQQRTEPNERSTEGFNLLNAGILYELPRETQNFRFYLRVKNILNQEARLHTSFLKEVAPLPGRNFIAGVQALF